MSNSSQTPWFDGPNAPQIPYPLYLEEKARFAGALICAVLYGMAIILFFQCMCALLSPVNRTRRDVKWGLVAHTVAAFSFVTIYTTISLNILSISYIDNRGFPGINGALPPGPLGYIFSIYPKAISIARTVMFILNNWLADALLLYRCYVIYAMNQWVIAFPCAMYLASLATGITYIYQVSQPVSVSQISSTINKFGIPHHSISVSLNVLLTLMIATRLMMHRRDIRNSVGPSVPTGLYKVVVVILVESCALYTVSFLLFVGLWVAKNPTATVFFSIVIQTQVIAPQLIIIRAINESTSMEGVTITRDDRPIHFRAQAKWTCDDGALHGRSTNSSDTVRETASDLSFGAVTTGNLHREEV